MLSLHGKKTYILLATFGLLILSLILFFIWPLIKEIDHNSQALLMGKNDTVILKMQSDEIENFKKIHKDYQPNLDKMHQLFIDAKNPVGFIKFLEEAASVSSIKPQISLIPNQKDQNTITFQLSTSGNFLNILDFLKRIENGQYLVEIKNINIKNGDTTNTAKNYPSGRVDATFLINTFSKF